MLSWPHRFPAPVRALGLLSVLTLPLALVSACDSTLGNPPVARATASPSIIPENDGFQTAVTLDGSASSDVVDDPENTIPLSFQWVISGDEYRYEDGTDTSAAPVLSFRGDRPATVELTVTDADGLSNTAVFQTQITVSQ